MSDLTTFNALVDTRIKDSEGVLTSAEIDAAVAEAVTTYSKHRPHELLADLAGDGDYDYAVPADWVLDCSAVRRVEYPAGERVPVYLEDDQYTLYKPDAQATVLRFLDVTPQAGQTARVTYTAPHVVDADSSTIPANDEECVGNLAASVACEWIASHYSQQGDPTLSADTTDHRSKASDYAARAKRFRALAYEHLGISTSKDGTGQASVATASATREWDSDFAGMTGIDRLTHPRRWR
jgi:hypothetical protein